MNRGTLAYQGTVKNTLSKLRAAGAVEDTGDIEPGGGKVVAETLDRNRHRTFKGDGDDYDFLTVERAVEALRHGNAPRKALENYRNGVQDFESVVRSVLHFWHKNAERWKEAAPSVLGALDDLADEAEG